MPRTNKKKKSSQRGATSAKAAQSRPRRDAGQAASAAAPTAAPAGRSGPAVTAPAAGAVPPGLVRAQKVPPGLAPGQTAPPGLAPGQTAPPGGLVAGTSEYARLVPSLGLPVRSAPAGPPGPAGVPAPEGAGSGTPAAETPDDLPGWAARAMAELLTVTYWLDPGEDGEPFGATVRFSGRRAEVAGKPQPGDTFSQDETVEGILPGSGPVAITTEVRGIHAGQWTVSARPLARSIPPGKTAAAASRVPWPRRVAIPATSEAAVRTASLLRSKVPGIIRFAYAALVSLGVLVGLVLEGLLLSRGHYPVFRPELFSALAVLAGVVGGKAWYIAVHRGRKFDGWCIQGFITGAAVVVAAAAWAGTGVPAGAYLGAAAVALLIGMAIGRPGCFWAGCCTGRPTAARWGVWSSDRRVGCRRTPAQLLEALASLVVGLAVLAMVLNLGLARSGPVAVAGLAAFTLIRQFILRLRAEPPGHWRYGRLATGLAGTAALIVSAILLALG